jgi:hypothetical protein
MSHVDVGSLFADLSSERARTRFAAGKALCSLSEAAPSAVYPHFQSLVNLMHHPNQILKWNALRSLANLACVDTAGKLDRILEEYLALIDGRVMITAAHAIEGAAQIATAKPYLAARIARKILRVELADYGTDACRDVAIGHALKAIERIAPLLPDKTDVRAFAERQRRSLRPATARKAARVAEQLASRRIRATSA